MILTTHMLAGAALGANVQNPYAVAGLAVILHFVLDLLPHGDYLNKNSRLREFWKVAIDLLVGIALIAPFLFIPGKSSGSSLNILIGVFFSLFPDGTTFLYIWMKVKFLRPLKDFHARLHYYPDSSPRRQFRFKNNLFDILISLISLIILIYP